MKILVAGGKNKTKKPKKFECFDCGCIFVADNTEYIDESTEIGPFFSISCPSCGALVTSATDYCSEDSYYQDVFDELRTWFTNTLIEKLGR